MFAFIDEDMYNKYFKGPFTQGCVITGYKMSETDVLSQGSFEKLDSFMWNFYS